jgi:hypothetical protein
MSAPQGIESLVIVRAIIIWVLSGTLIRYGAATSRVFAIYENFQDFFRFRSSSL